MKIMDYVENLDEQFENALAEKQKSLKLDNLKMAFKTIMVPFASFGAMALFFKSIPLLIVGLAITGSSAISIAVIEKRRAKEVSNIELLYKDDYEEFSSAFFTDEMLKYNEALEKQHENVNIPYDDGVYDYNEAIAIVVDEFLLYYDSYLLPKQVFSGYEWELVYGTIYEYYNKKNMSHKYYSGISEYTRYVLAQAIVNRSEFLSVENFIAALTFFCTQANFSPSEVKSMQQDVRRMLIQEKNKPKSNVISFKKK